MSLQRIGKWYDPSDDYSPFPSPFTPAIGAAFTAFESDDMRVGLLGDLSFPAVQNVRVLIGGNATYRDFLTLETAFRLDFKEMFDDDVPMRTPVPSFGIALSFKTDLKQQDGIIAEQGWNSSEVRARAAAAPLQNNVWGFGVGATAFLGVIDTNPPAMNVSYPDMRYLSPNHDGRSDDLTVPISITDERYVKGYRFVIQDESGNVIREIRNKDERPENEGFKNIMDRLTAVKSGISIPEVIRWDGTTDGGQAADDGSYSFFLESWDDNGNISRTQAKRLEIDTAPPEVTVRVRNEADLIFSPNNDGNKDTLPLEQTGSAEDLWKGEIVDSAGRTVRTFSWRDGTPLDVSWDGKNDQGVLVPDGVYAYRMMSTDRAENGVATGIDNIIIDTEPTPIKLAIDTSWFSPNADGRQDTVEFSLGIPVREGIDRWTLTVSDARGRAVRTYSGSGNPAKVVAFDGKDDRGAVLPEGAYRGGLQVVYRNGNNPKEESPSFTLDITAPVASITSTDSIFSPNGDGNKDSIVFYQETSMEDGWTGEIRDDRQNAVRTFTWRQAVEGQLVWDGRGQDGRIMQDGPYSYRLFTHDRAGNRGESKPVVFRLNTEETPVLISAEYTAFSPNGDGTKDRINLLPQLKVGQGIASWELRIQDSGSQTVRTITGRGAPGTSFTWDGMIGPGRRAPDGTYRADLTVTYENGNQPRATSAPFVLDTALPEATVSATYTLFSPDGDGKKDNITFAVSTSTEALWEGRILNAKNEPVRTVYWKDTVRSHAWDGTDEAGNRVADGTYRFVLSSRDEAGNLTEKSVEGIVVDTRPTRLFATVDKKGFSPNSDGFADDIAFALYVNLPDGIEGWQLQILHEDGTAVKRFSGPGSSIPKEIRWDGKEERGSVREGSFTGVFTVTYAKGNQPEARTTPFLLDVTAPEVNVGLQPKPFSPDNDGVDDEIYFSMNVKDRSDIRDWNLIIRDPVGNFFNEFYGTGAPGETIIWDGRSSDGELVQAAEDYPFEIKVTDSLGNSVTRKGVIPVDVLVIRDGDRLKIRISSITFAPNSPEFVTNDPEQSAKNLRILRRLAEILNKYDRYRIRIEGHAVRIYWDQPARGEREEREELQPLSEARANTVRKALTDLGVDGSRIQVLGMGGKEPVVPHGDLENRWKNRRVEFILIR